MDEAPEQILSKSGFDLVPSLGGVNTFVFIFNSVSEVMTGRTFCASVAVA